jgi:single-stranded DNA-binding protein
MRQLLRAVFIEVAAFRKQADLCADYLEKGGQVAVNGRLECSEHQDAEGNQRSRHDGRPRGAEERCLIAKRHSFSPCSSTGRNGKGLGVTPFRERGGYALRRRGRQGHESGGERASYVGRKGADPGWSLVR